MSQSREPNLPVFEQTQTQKILVEPSFRLQFVCTPFQTTASLRILVSGDEQNDFQYNFRIKATNKQDYKVTQSQGQLCKNVNKLIYFYLKQSAPINKNLKDKFLLIINKSLGNGLQQLIFSRKFQIVIESGFQAKNSHSIIPQVAPEVNNVSKFLSSVYSSPSTDVNRLYQPRSELRQTFLPPITSTNTLLTSSKYNHLSPGPPKSYEGQSKKSTNSIQEAQIEQPNLRPSVLVSQRKKNQNMKNSQININSISSLNNYDPDKLQLMLMEEQKLKLELNGTIKQIEHLKRKIISIDNQNKSNKARARFRTYFNIFIVIFAFIFGMWIKSLHIVDKVQHFADSFKGKLSSSFDGTGISNPNKTIL